MIYNIFKLHFNSPVHFGKGRLSGTTNTIYADTLFSALCSEAIKIYGDDGADIMCSLVKEGGLRISDTMPFFDDVLFIPKPIIAVKGKERQKDDNSSKLKKAFKKLTYIPTDDLDVYLKGEYEPARAVEMLSDIGYADVSAKAAIIRNDDNLPYSVGTYRFNEGCGLYFIAGAENVDVLYKLSDVMDSLSYTGIGGEISSGYGNFTYTCSESIPKVLKEGLDTEGDMYISLSLSMAKDSELDNIIDESCYELIKRSGFVASERYSLNPLRKKDFYCFKAGSCFRKKFEGDIFDVSSVNGGGRHSVYKYAVPMLLGIKRK